METKPYKLMTQTLITNLKEKALQSQRLRTNYNFHHLTDTVQRFMNVASRETYIRPHKHPKPGQTETFIILQGTIRFLIFDDAGKIIESVMLSKDGEKIGIDVTAGLWHSFVVITETAALFEIKEGPYDAATDKIFAEFAPEENTEDAIRYLKKIKKLA